MNARRVLRALTALTAAAVLVSQAVGVAAAAATYVPAGTPVGLQFVTAVASDRIRPGAEVEFRVVADVVQGRDVIIRAGTPVTGTVREVTRPGMFGASAKVVIGFIAPVAVDGRPISVTDVIVSKQTIDENRAGAAGVSVAGAIVLGPVGLLAGVLVRGGEVEVPQGTVVTETTRTDASVWAP